MNALNLQTSVNNVTQMDRHQHDAGRAPTVYQDQNAAIARNEAEKRIRMPTPLDESEGKKIDARSRKNDSGNKNKKQKRNSKNGDHGNAAPLSPSGYIVDMQA